MAELITSGVGEYEAVADRARVGVTISGTGRDRQTALASLADRTAAVDQALDRDGVDVRSRHVSVTADWQARRRTGSRATLALLVRVVDLAALEPLLTALVQAEPSSLDGPRWELTDRAVALREAQRHAVADAQTSAEGYAAATGMRLGPLLRLSDGAVAQPGSARSVALAARARHTADDVAELQLDPEPVVVRAECTATWELLA